MIEAAPGIPMSASVRVNRDELLDLLDEAVENLPDELRAARWLLKERDEYMERTRREAEDFCDQRLASFENVLAKVQRSVAVGRQRLAAPSIEESELRGFDGDAAPDHAGGGERPAGATAPFDQER